MLFFYLVGSFLCTYFSKQGRKNRGAGKGGGQSPQSLEDQLTPFPTGGGEGADYAHHISIRFSIPQIFKPSYGSGKLPLHSQWP